VTPLAQCAKGKYAVVYKRCKQTVSSAFGLLSDSYAFVNLDNGEFLAPHRSQKKNRFRSAGRRHCAMCSQRLWGYTDNPLCICIDSRHSVYVTHHKRLSNEQFAPSSSLHRLKKEKKNKIFTARQHSSSYAKRCISYDRFCLTVWPSDRPSQSGIMPKPL